MRTVDGRLLDLRRPVMLVDDVSLVVDRSEIPCRGEDLLGGAGRDDHPVRDRIIIRRISRR
jgi:hypothetical protein